MCSGVRLKLKQTRIICTIDAKNVVIKMQEKGSGNVRYVKSEGFLQKRIIRKLPVIHSLTWNSFACIVNRARIVYYFYANSCRFSRLFCNYLLYFFLQFFLNFRIFILPQFLCRLIKLRSSHIIHIKKFTSAIYFICVILKYF